MAAVKVAVSAVMMVETSAGQMEQRMAERKVAKLVDPLEQRMVEQMVEWLAETMGKTSVAKRAEWSVGRTVAPMVQPTAGLTAGT